jgi:hypothetical protein
MFKTSSITNYKINRDYKQIFSVFKSYYKKKNLVVKYYI